MPRKGRLAGMTGCIDRRNVLLYEASLRHLNQDLLSCSLFFYLTASCSVLCMANNLAHVALRESLNAREQIRSSPSITQWMGSLAALPRYRWLHWTFFPNHTYAHTCTITDTIRYLYSTVNVRKQAGLLQSFRLHPASSPPFQCAGL